MFTTVKNRSILHGRVFVMHRRVIVTEAEFLLCASITLLVLSRCVSVVIQLKDKFSYGIALRVRRSQKLLLV